MNSCDRHSAGHPVYFIHIKSRKSGRFTAEHKEKRLTSVARRPIIIVRESMGECRRAKSGVATTTPVRMWGGCDKPECRKSPLEVLKKERKLLPQEVTHEKNSHSSLACS